MAFDVGVSVVDNPVAKDVVLPSLNHSNVPVQLIAVNVILVPTQIFASLTLIEGFEGGATTVIVAVFFEDVHVPIVHVASYIVVVLGLAE